MVDLPITSLRDLSLLAQSLLEIGKYLGLSEDECKHPKCGEWIVEELKNNDTTTLLKMQINLKRRIKEDMEHNPLDILTGNTT